MHPLCRVQYAVTPRRSFLITVLCSATAGLTAGVGASSWLWSQKLAAEVASEHYRTVLSDAIDVSMVCQQTSVKMLDNPGVGDYPPTPSSKPRYPQETPS